MPVWHDYYCPRCRAELRDQPSRPRCEECDTPMEIVCNGGCGHARYRYADLPSENPRWWDDQVRYIPGSASISEDDEGTQPCKHFKTGEAIQLHEDRLAEQNDRRRFGRARRFGYNRIWGKA